MCSRQSATRLEVRHGRRQQILNQPESTCRSGFTAIELVIMIVILGIVSGTVIPTLSRLGDLRKGAAMTMMMRDIRLAQSMAMSQQLHTWIAFDVTQESYQIYIEPSSGAGKGGRIALEDPMNHGALIRDLDDLALGDCTLNTVDFGGTTELEFDENGDPYDGNGSAITTSGLITFGDGATITIHGQTGFAELTP